MSTQTLKIRTGGGSKPFGSCLLGLGSDTVIVGTRDRQVGFLSTERIRGVTLAVLTSIVLPLMDEIESLNKTVAILLEDNDPTSMELIFVYSPRSSEAAVRNVKRLAAETSVMCKCAALVQESPQLGGALRTGFAHASGTHVVMMASDLETDPHTVKRLISTSASHPGAVIATTRWSGTDAGFDGYGKAKLLANWLFQRGISVVYGTHLSDLTFGFRLYPVGAVKDAQWSTANFAFLLESILRPLASGYEVIEIPTVWRARTEGKSSNSWRYYMTYFKVAAEIRWRSPR